MQSRFWAIAGIIFLCAGMIAAFSRGPWVGAVAGVFMFLLLQPNPGRSLLKGAIIVALIVGVALISPLGDKFISYLPFVGTIEAANVTYRERLLEVAWGLVQQHPFFGTPFYLESMEELRQGQGIIDTVNTFATVAMASGLVGLGIFATFFLGHHMERIYGGSSIGCRRRRLFLDGRGIGSLYGWYHCCDGYHQFWPCVALHRVVAGGIDLELYPA